MNFAAELAELRAQRDLEIWQLHAAGVGTAAISRCVGVSKSQIYEVLHPERRERYNRLQRERYRAARVELGVA